MNTDIPSLMQNVYDYFLDLFHQRGDAAPDSSFLSFEAIGRPLPPDQFKLQPGDADYSPALAVEQCSLLVNSIPAIDADLFRRSGKTVEEFYGLLLLGAQAANATNLDLMAALKAQAVQRFDGTLGSLVRGRPPYHPSFASPVDWYDPTVATNWTNYSFRSSSGPATRPNAPPVRIDPGRRAWQWQVVAADLAPALARPQLLEQAQVQVTPALRDQVTRLRLDPDLLEHVASRAQLRASVNPEIALRTAGTLGVDLAATQLAARPGIELAQQLTRPVREALPIAETESDLGARVIERQVLLPARLAQLIENSRPQPVESNAFEISFSYCLVMIDRPWLSQAFLATQGWYVPGYAASAFSTGGVEGNAGLFPALPIAFLVAKDVSIRANWSSADRQAAEQSASFGPFSLLGRSFEQSSNALICEGMQVIAWICQIMPQLPPLAAPDSQ